MGKASSAKKVARLAERGKGKKIRFQGGSVFPIIIAVIVVLGVSLVGYARHQSKADAAGPQLGTHWHIAYGIYDCDKYLDPFQDNKESSATYQDVQIHSHGDGVMHWHPSSEQAINRSTGRKAKFKVFLDLYNVQLTDKKLTVAGSELTPPGADIVREEGKDTCTINGKAEKSSLRVIVWDRYDEPGKRIVRTSSLGEERVLKDQEVFVVAFLPDSVANADIPIPPWATDLPTLGAADSNSATPTTVPGETTVPGQTTVPGAATVPSATTVSATTVAPTTSA